MNRRSLLLGLGGILAAAAAPAIVRAGVLMPVRPRIWTPYDLDPEIRLDVHGWIELNSEELLAAVQSGRRMPNLEIWRGHNGVGGETKLIAKIQITRDMVERAPKESRRALCEIH